MTAAPTASVSGLRAAQLVRRLARRRLMRSRGFWVSLCLIGLPLLLSQGILIGKSAGQRDAFDAGFELLVLLLGVVPPIHLAAAVADEIEGRTYTYLWSRPLPRWTLVVGKLWATAPILGAMLAAGALMVNVLAFGGGEPALLVRSMVALVLGGLAAGMVALGVGSLVTRHPMAATVSYLLLLDGVLGKIPFAVRSLSISHNVRAIAGVTGGSDTSVARALGMRLVDDPLVATAWTLGIGAAWLAVAIWRTSRVEYAAKA